MKLRYVAQTKDKKIQKGLIEAQDKVAAAKILKEKGLFILEIKEPSRYTVELKLKKKVHLKDKVVFYKELSVMNKAGLPLLEALQALGEENNRNPLGQALGRMIQDVEGGQSLSESMAMHPKLFSKIEISVIKSGEKSGKLDDVLLKLSDQLEKDYQLISKVKGAMTYPMVIFFALIAVMILVITLVIPQLEKVFLDAGIPLPAITRALIWSGKAFSNYWFIIIPVTILICILIYLWFKTPTGSALLDRFKIKCPGISQLMKKIYMARFCRTSATLIGAGVPILEIFETAGRVINNSIFLSSLTLMAKNVKNGSPFSEELRKNNLFPALMVSLVKTGEKSGKLDYVLITLADYYENEVDNTTRNLSSMIEPVMLVIMGVGVALLIASVLGPIYNLVSAI